MAKNGEKKAKLTKSGKPRKNLPQGLTRVTMFTERTTKALTGMKDRVARWATKTPDQVAKDRLITVAHMFSEAMKNIETAVSKVTALDESGWVPPKAASYVKTEDFEIGERVTIKEQFQDTYVGLDQKVLANMKIINQVKQGKKTYYVTNAGFLPKAHLESFAE